MYNKRQQTILQYLQERGEATNQELLDLVGDVSTMTLWRDLTLLEKEGKILRYRGGAMIQGEKEQGLEINFLKRERVNVQEKDSIARIVGPLLTPGQSYYLDAGSTVYAVLPFLQQGNYNFITSAVNNAAVLASRLGSDVTMLGGQLNGNTMSCSGHMAEYILSQMNIDIAVMATSGYEKNSGFTSGRLAEAELKRHVIEKAYFTIMLMDHGKYGKRHPFTFADLEDVDVLITDEEIQDDVLALCKEKNVTVFSPNDGLTQEQRLEKIQILFQDKATN